MKKMKNKVMALLLFAILAILIFLNLFTVIKWVLICAVTVVIGIVGYTAIEGLFIKKPKGK